MPSSEQNLLPRPPIHLGWATVISLLTALVASGTVALHLIGVVRHRVYLHHWGIDAGLFPKATDWLLINGYYGLVDRFVAILVVILSNFHWVFAAALALGLYLKILLSPAAAGSGEPPKWLLRLPEWARRMIRQMLLTTLVVSALPLGIFLFTALMVIPAVLGEKAGEAAAKADTVEYAKGCEKSKHQCVQLTRNGELIAKGFILDDSPAQIAIFEPERQRGRTIPRDGLEMMSTRVSFDKLDRTP